MMIREWEVSTAPVLTPVCMELLQATPAASFTTGQLWVAQVFVSLSYIRSPQMEYGMLRGGCSGLAHKHFTVGSIFGQFSRPQHHESIFGAHHRSAR